MSLSVSNPLKKSTCKKKKVNMFLISSWGTHCPAPQVMPRSLIQISLPLQDKWKSHFFYKVSPSPNPTPKTFIRSHCSCPPLQSLESTDNFLASTATSNRHRTCGISCFLGTLRSIFLLMFCPICSMANSLREGERCCLIHYYHHRSALHTVSAQ